MTEKVSFDDLDLREEPARDTVSRTVGLSAGNTFHCTGGNSDHCTDLCGNTKYCN